MTQTSELYHSILKMVNQRQFTDAESSISSWSHGQNLSNTDFQFIEHLKSLILIQKGELSNALEVLSLARKSFGDNICLVMEQACCHYQLSQWGEWKSTYREIETILTDSTIEIDSTKEAEALILLGKFYEEEGAIAKARELYLSAQEITPKELITLKLKAKTQLLRLEATFGSKESIGSIYAELIQVQKSEIHLDLEIEVEHAMMLSEMNLIGLQHASERLLKILMLENILVTDKSLMLYDFLEECVINHHTPPAWTINWCDKITPFDEFEIMILNLIKNSGSEMTLPKLMSLSSLVSPASYLRLLTLALKTLPQCSAEIKNKLHLLLTAVDGPSRHLWNRRVDLFTESSQKLLSFDLEKRVISFESKGVDLSRKRGMLIFAELIAQKGDMTVEDMIEKIWQSEYSPDHFHRLRMTAHRMNQILFDLTSIEKSIEVSADRIKINPKIKFKCTGKVWNS